MINSAPEFGRSRLRRAAEEKAAKRKADTAGRVRNALKELLAEIAAAETGSEFKHPELSLASIAKRAGVDRKTLNQPYHAALKREVLEFISRHKQRSPQTEKRRTASRFAIITAAYDQIAIENRMLRKQLSEHKTRIAELEGTSAH